MSKSGQKTAIFIAAVILGFFGAYVLSKKFSNKTPQINPGTPAPESESEEEQPGGGGMAGGSSVSGGGGVLPILNPTNDTKTPPKVAKGAVKDLPLGTMTTTVPGSSTTTRSAPPTTGNPTTGVQIVGVILEGANGQGTTTAPTAPTVPSVGTAGAGMTFGTPSTTTRRTKTIAGFGVNRGTNYLNDCGCQYL